MSTPFPPSQIFLKMSEPAARVSLSGQHFVLHNLPSRPLWILLRKHWAEQAKPVGSETIIWQTNDVVGFVPILPPIGSGTI